MSFWEICGELSNVIATALAALSIYLTVKEQKETRKYEKYRNVVEQKLLWYNEVVLNDIIRNMNEFVEGTRKQLERCREKTDKTTIENELHEIYNSTNEKFKSVKEKIFLLKTFSQALYKECDDKLQEIFDIYSNVINDATRNKRISSINTYKIQMNKGEIFSALYKWANDFVETEGR